MVLPLLAAGVIVGAAAIGGAIAKAAAGNNGRRPKLILPQDQAFRERLALQAMGGGPSVVEQQAQQSTNAVNAQALSLAAGARGPNIGLAQRQAQVSAAAAEQGIAADAQTARIQEQLAAQGAYSNYLWNETAARENYEARRQADAEARAAKRAAMWGGIFGGIGSAAGAMGGVGGAGAAAGGGGGGAAGMAAGASAYNASQYAQGGGQGYVTLNSDERLKTDVQSGGGAVREALDQVAPVVYRYREGAEDGPDNSLRAGVMAQQLAQTPAGRALVVQQPGGALGIREDRATGFNLAALADLNARLERLEKKRGAR